MLGQEWEGAETNNLPLKNLLCAFQLLRKEITFYYFEKTVIASYPDCPLGAPWHSDVEIWGAIHTAPSALTHSMQLCSPQVKRPAQLGSQVKIFILCYFAWLLSEPAQRRWKLRVAHYAHPHLTAVICILKGVWIFEV